MAAFLLYIPAFLILYIFTKHFLNKIQNLPPTPFPCLPIIGHLYLLKKPLYKTLARVAAKNGAVSYLQFGNRPLLILSSQEAAEQCLTLNDIVFASRPNLMVAEHIGNGRKNLVWSPYGDNWRNLRRIATVEILSNSRLQMLSSIRIDEIRLLIRKITDFQDKPLDFRTLFFELTLNVMMLMVAGKRYYGDNVADVEEASRFRASQVEYIKVISATNFGDFVPWLKSKKLEQRMIHAHKNRVDFFLQLIEQSRGKLKKNQVSEKKMTLVEVLLSQQESDPEYYTDDLIANLMLVLLSAGTETSTNTMEWTLSLLLNHPEVMQKAREEIEAVVGFDRLVDESDIPRLHYIRCIINESMRMYPALPLLLPHESTRECKVGGYNVPSGTFLFVNVWAIQNDPNVWEEPRRFKPERFEGMAGMTKEGFKLIPFGSGRRSCPGDNLAMRIVGLTLGSLIQCFEWERIDQEMVDMSEETGVTMAKARPLQAKCRPRPAIIKLLSEICS